MPAARLPRWVNRYPPRGFAPRSAGRYTKPRGSPLWTTGTTSAVPLRGVNIESRLTHRGKLWALWLSGWHLGVVDTYTEAALITFIKRQTGLDAAKWVHDTHDSAKAVEGLKAWLCREAGVDWSPYAGVDAAGSREQIDNPRARVLEAQWRILAGLGVVKIDDPGALSAYAARHAGIARTISHSHLEADEAKALIAHLGARIRTAKAGGARAGG